MSNVKLSIHVENPRGFKELSLNAIKPTRGTDRSAGYDFYVPKNYPDTEILPGETVVIPTDIAAWMQDDEVLNIYIRSSMGIKKRLKVTNQVGVIDSDYFGNPDNGGNIHIALENTGKETVIIKAEDRIVQGVFSKYLTTNDRPLSSKRMGGIGSTG